MTTVEEYHLTRCEDIIERNMSAFVEVGLALLEIRESRLYKATHSTFEEYCRERWGMSKTYATRTIQASKYVNDIRDSVPTGNTLPIEVPRTEREARAAIAASKPLPEFDSFVAVPVDIDALRCEEIMRELTANPSLARLVRIELMKWYALNE